MADFDDELVRHARAVVELERLSAAYFASARAHVIVLDRFDRIIRTSDDDVSQKAGKLSRIARDRGLSVETGTVFAARRVQLRRRRLDVDDLPILEGGE